MKIKTSELTGAALDWAVAKCEGFRDGDAIIRIWNNRVTKIIPGDYETVEVYTSYSPSTDWAQGGPIIDRMQLNRLTTNIGGGYTASVKVTLINTDDDAYMVWTHGSGPTPLIAAMRCRVAFKMGDTVDVPEELV